MGNYIRWHFECEACSTTRTDKEDFGGDSATVRNVQLPYGWSRIGAFLVCEKHTISKEEVTKWLKQAGQSL